jgi:hypothetical protein
MGGSCKEIRHPRDMKDIRPDPRIREAEQFINLPSHSTGYIGMLRVADMEGRGRVPGDHRHHASSIQHSRYIGGEPHAADL